MADFALRAHRWSRAVSNAFLDDRLTVRQRADKYSDFLMEADRLLGEAVEKERDQDKESSDG